MVQLEGESSGVVCETVVFVTAWQARQVLMQSYVYWSIPGNHTFSLKSLFGFTTPCWPSWEMSITRLCRDEGITSLLPLSRRSDVDTELWPLNMKTSVDWFLGWRHVLLSVPEECATVLFWPQLWTNNQLWLLVISAMVEKGLGERNFGFDTLKSRLTWKRKELSLWDWLVVTVILNNNNANMNNDAEFLEHLQILN